MKRYYTLLLLMPFLGACSTMATQVKPNDVSQLDEIKPGVISEEAKRYIDENTICRDEPALHPEVEKIMEWVKGQTKKVNACDKPGPGNANLRLGLGKGMLLLYSWNSDPRERSYLLDQAFNQFGMSIRDLPDKEKNLDAYLFQAHVKHMKSQYNPAWDAQARTLLAKVGKSKMTWEGLEAWVKGELDQFTEEILNGKAGTEDVANTEDETSPPVEDEKNKGLDKKAASKRSPSQVEIMRDYLNF